MLLSVKSSSDHESQQQEKRAFEGHQPVLNGSLLAFSSLPHEREN